MNTFTMSLKRLYDEGRITQEKLRKAVDLGWITAEEYMEIIGGKDGNN